MAKKLKRRTPEEKAAIMKQIDDARAKGTTFGDACKAAGITDHTYYNWRAKGKRKPAKAPKLSPQLITLPLDADMPLVIVMGKAGEVTQALSRLSAIRGA